MAKFVVAFRDRDTAEKIASILREGGYEVLRICTGGDEVRRVFRTIQDGILICGNRVKDRPLDRVIEDLNEHVEVLCLARPDQISQVNSSRVFRLGLPVTRAVLTAWADMLIQLHYQKMPHRNDVDSDLITEAKQKIMSDKHMSESEAHRYLQQLSMKQGVRMAKVAEDILSHDDN